MRDEDVDVLKLFLESRGIDPRKARKLYEKSVGSPGFGQFLRHEAELQGRLTKRRIDGNVYNACMQMFLKRPRRHNHFRTLWAVAERRVAGLTGIDKDFDPKTITPRVLKRVARVLDELFTENTLLRYIEKKHSAMRFVVEDEANPEVPDGAMYHDSDKNTIGFVREVWEQDHPKKMDGVHVKSKLEMLCHTMGHELCHALANVACGKTCAKMARNHGRVFRRLNHALFGHPGEDKANARKKK